MVVWNQLSAFFWANQNAQRKKEIRKGGPLGKSILIGGRYCVLLTTNYQLQGGMLFSLI
jgi:hypothetical protein